MSTENSGPVDVPVDQTEASRKGNELESENSQPVPPHTQLQEQPVTTHTGSVPTCASEDESCDLSLTRPEEDIHPTDNPPPFVDHNNKVSLLHV